MQKGTIRKKIHEPTKGTYFKCRSLPARAGGAGVPGAPQDLMRPQPFSAAASKPGKRFTC